MKKILMVLSLSLLLVGCGGTNPKSALLKTARDLDTESVHSTYSEDVPEKLEFGTLITDTMKDYYEDLVDGMKSVNLDDEKFSDEDKLIITTTIEFYEDFSAKINEHFEKLEAAYSGLRNEEDIVLGVYLYKIPVDWNFDQDVIDQINNFGEDKVLKNMYIYVNKNVLVMAEPTFVADRDAFFEAITPIVEEHLDY